MAKLTKKQAEYVLSLGRMAAEYRGCMFGAFGGKSKFYTGLSLANEAFRAFGLGVTLKESPKRQRRRAPVSP